MPSINLIKMLNRNSTNPNQPPIPLADSFNVSEGELTAVDVISNDNCIFSKTKTLVSVSGAVNCTAVKFGNLINVTGSIAGAGSFSYVVSDGTTTATGSVSLNILSSMASVLITDATLTDFGSEVSVNDTLYYSSSTAITGAVVSVDFMGQISIVGTYQPGDSFSYRVNSGLIQTFTFI